MTSPTTPFYAAEFFATGTMIHILGPGNGGEFTLCGVAQDAWDSENMPELQLIPTARRVVTCPQCAAVVLVCRGVQVRIAGDPA